MCTSDLAGLLAVTGQCECNLSVSRRKPPLALFTIRPSTATVSPVDDARLKQLEANLEKSNQDLKLANEQLKSENKQLHAKLDTILELLQASRAS